MSGHKNGFLPCFSKHIDKTFSLDDFYRNQAFIGKLKSFLSAIIDSPTIDDLNNIIHPKGGIQHIDPNGNKDDKQLCQRLGWVESKIYRVDYGNCAYRLLFSLNFQEKRCYILALDTNHQTRNGKKH